MPTTLPTTAQCNLWTAVYVDSLAKCGSKAATERADEAVALMTERMPEIVNVNQLERFIQELAELRLALADMRTVKEGQ